MQESAFVTELRSGGYTQIESKALSPKPGNVELTHDYDVRGLLLDGVFIVRQGDQSVTYRTGDIFAVPAGKKHSEEIGPHGARILVGRKY
jgi:quercetin dioxygenase-like cupin family protein